MSRAGEQQHHSQVFSDDDYPMTLKEIAARVGGSEATICREIQEAVRWLWRQTVASKPTPLFGDQPVTRKVKQRRAKKPGDAAPTEERRVAAQGAFKW